MIRVNNLLELKCIQSFLLIDFTKIWDTPNVSDKPYGQFGRRACERGSQLPGGSLNLWDSCDLNPSPEWPMANSNLTFSNVFLCMPSPCTSH